MAYTYTITKTLSNISVTDAGAVLWVSKSTAQSWMHSDGVPSSIRLQGTVTGEQGAFRYYYYSIKDSGYNFLNNVTVSAGKSKPYAFDATLTVNSTTWANTMAIILEVPFSTTAHVTMTGVTMTITYSTNIAPTSDFSVGNVSLGGTSTVTITPAASSLTHKVIWSIGSYSQTNSVAAGTKTSSYTIPASWGAAFSTANSGTLTVKVETYQGGTKTGDKTKTVTLSCPSYTPSASLSASVVDAVSGKYGQYKSKCKLTGSGSTSYGATIKSYSLSGHGISVSAASGTTSVLTKQGSLTYTLTVTDSRGKTKSATASITVTACGGPSISVSNVTAGNSNTVSISHTYNSNLYHKVTWSIGSQSNTVTTSKAATSAAYTIPAAWSSQIPNANTGTITVTVTSYDADNKSVGSASKTLTMTCASYTPSCSLGATVVDAVNSTYGQYKSKCKLTITASSSYGATIKSYSISGHGISVTTSSGTTSVITKQGSLTYTASVTDSRGKTKSATVTISVAPCGPCTITAGDVTAGNSHTVTVSHTYNSHLRHTVKWTAGSQNQSQDIAKAGTSSSYTIPVAWANQFTTAMSGNLTITVTSYDEDNKSVGVATKTVRLNVPAYSPVVSALTATRIDNTVPSGWGVYVQGKSGVKLTATASSSYGATITSYTFTGDGITSSTGSGNTRTIDPIMLAGSVTYKVTITDSRGKTAEKTVAISVEAYSTPSFNNDTAAVRSGSDGTEDEYGECIKVTPKVSFSSCGSHNTVTVTCVWSDMTRETWSNQEDTPNDTSTIYDPIVFSVDHGYYVKLTVTDSFGASNTIEIHIPSLAMGWHIKEGNTGLAAGMIAERDGFEVNPDWEVYVKGMTLRQYILQIINGGG